jgi:hypothetical protein
MTDFHTTEGFDEYHLDDKTPVRIICVDAPGHYPIVVIDEVGLTYHRHADGTAEDCPAIVKSTPRIKGERWLVVWCDEDGNDAADCWNTRLYAEDQRRVLHDQGHPVAILHVPFDLADGEGVDGVD